MDMVQGIFTKEQFQVKLNEDDYQKFIEAYISSEFESQKAFQQFIRKLKFKYNKQALIKMYRMTLKEMRINRSHNFEKFMVKKATRGHSGVNVITIFTSPVQFGDLNGDLDGDVSNTSLIKKGGCPMNCHYCPFEKDENNVPTQPRSYLSTEPGNMRATQNLHHPIGQMFDRIFTLEEIGHITPFFNENNGTKLEIIISGGTFNFYPHDYIEWFVTCMYFAANVYEHYREFNQFPRDILSLDEEQQINETSSLRIIGLTIETRPDYLNPRDFDKKEKDEFAVLRFLRRLGVTRVQIGLQHTSDEVLNYVNRQCTDEKNREAIYFLKQNGFKVDGHWMLDLPMPSHLDPVKTDTEMMTHVLTNSDYELDQWKIYPTEVTNFTKIKEWYDAGTYKPYAELEDGKYLEDVIIHTKKLMKPWIRINRIIRDIPIVSIEGGIMCTDMRNRIEQKMKEQGLFCKCIRCREIKLKKINYDTVEFKKRIYEGSNGTEYFLSFETTDEKNLLGYLRLRLNKSNQMVMPELHDTAFIRELHVLGKHTEINKELNNSNNSNTQHRGYGKQLIKIAEEIALENGFKKIAIISGIGVREYYRKQGYFLKNSYMMKELNYNYTVVYLVMFATIIFLLFLFLF
jgi:ELP3 family radical SAM enzyme/protein acetyltransferase